MKAPDSSSSSNNIATIAGASTAVVVVVLVVVGALIAIVVFKRKGREKEYGLELKNVDKQKTGMTPSPYNYVQNT